MCHRSILVGHSSPEAGVLVAPVSLRLLADWLVVCVEYQRFPRLSTRHEAVTCSPGARQTGRVTAYTPQRSISSDDRMWKCSDGFFKTKTRASNMYTKRFFKFSQNVLAKTILLNFTRNLSEKNDISFDCRLGFYYSIRPSVRNQWLIDWFISVQCSLNTPEMKCTLIRFSLVK